MKFNSIEWAVCPECGCTINLWDAYPASIIMNEGRHFEYMTCPGAYGKKCGKKFGIRARRIIRLETVSLNEEEVK